MKLFKIQYNHQEGHFIHVRRLQIDMETGNALKVSIQLVSVPVFLFMLQQFITIKNKSLFWLSCCLHNSYQFTHHPIYILFVNRTALNNLCYNQLLLANKYTSDSGF